tara:strand:+ start:1149 stop:2600 length:1452 start_codon:yes stop_codon:yes gene_type:complete
MANLIGDASRAVFGNVGKDIARKVLDLLKSGRGDEVTPQMYSAADKQFLVENYDLPTDTASRLERGREGGFDFDTGRYHGGFDEIEYMADPSDVYMNPQAKLEGTESGTYSGQSYSGGGLYTSNDPSDAGDNYASLTGPDVRNQVTMELDKITDSSNLYDAANFMFDDMNKAEVQLIPQLLQHQAIRNSNIDGLRYDRVDPKDAQKVVDLHNDLLSRGTFTTGDFEELEDLVANVFPKGEFPPGFMQALAEYRITRGGGQVVKLVDRVENPVIIKGPKATVFKGGRRKLDPADYIDDAEQQIDQSAYPDKIEYREAVQERAEELAIDDSYSFEREGPAVDIIEDLLDNLPDDGSVGYDDLRSALYMHLDDYGEIDAEDLEIIFRNNVAGNYYDPDQAGPGQILNEVYRNAGFDAIDLPRAGTTFGFGPTGATHRVELDPTKIRSPSAMFDPRLSHLPNLTAVATPTAVGLGALSQIDEDEETQ